MERREAQGVTFVTLYARIVHQLAQNPHMSQEALARQLGVTMRTVQRHLTELEREGYIHVHREKKPFTYEVAWERRLPYFHQLHVSTFRPDTLEKLAGLEQVG